MTAWEARSPGIVPHQAEITAMYGAGETEVRNLVEAFQRVSVSDPPAVALDQVQQEALNDVMSGRNMFITGVGGTGKSVLLTAIKKKLEEKGKEVAVTAPTGLAAEVIEGCTIHSAAGIGVPGTISGFGRLSNFHKNRIKCYDVLMIDEVSMLSGEFMDRLSEHFAHARESSKPFGGLQVILFGDFLQLGPIDKTKERHKGGLGFCPALYLSRGWAFQGWAWGKLNLKYVELKNVYRQRDMAFVEVLRDIRLGKRDAVKVLEKLIDRAHPRRESTHQITTSTILVSTNKEADTYNKEQLEKLKGQSRFFSCKDSVVADEGIGVEQHQDAIAQLQRNGVPKSCRVPQNLELKTGAQVMMLKNMEVYLNGESTPRKLLNGSRGQVTGFAQVAGLLPELEKRRIDLRDELIKLPPDHAANETRESLEDRIKRITGQIAWTEAQQDDVQLRHNATASISVIPMVQWHSFDNHEPTPVFPEEFVFSTAGLGKNIRNQIPLMLAWTITMHKAQGMTLESIKVHAGRIFADGQLYVGLSRAKTVVGLTVEGLTKEKVMAAITAKDFHANPEESIHDRWWQRVPGLESDEHHKILNGLISKREPHQDATRTLSMHELKEEYSGEENWGKCDVCRQKLQCCYDVKDAIKKTIRKPIRKRVRGDSDERPSGRATPPEG
jgi:ATP-dependent DNA helicase PIF1